jgi:hypothetical protein
MKLDRGTLLRGTRQRVADLLVSQVSPLNEENQS